MTDQDDYIAAVKIISIIFIGICLITGIIGFISYKYHQIDIQNFQITIKDLSEEQKCLHICGFLWNGAYLENYKFCCEKCDRISERKQESI